MKEKRVWNGAIRILLVLILISGTLLANFAAPRNAEASSSDEPYLGEIRLFPYGFVPKGWAYSDGRILQVNSNLALYALIGEKYGGGGGQTFALPDLRGASPTPGTAYCIALTGLWPSEGSSNSDIAAGAFTGEVKLFPYGRKDLIPAGWRLADGQALSQTEYPALYATIGNRYGATESHFQLPDLPAPILNKEFSNSEKLRYMVAVKGEDDPDQIWDYFGALTSSLSASPPNKNMRIAEGKTLYNTSQYQALASLLWNRFGGDGMTTFSLPDLSYSKNNMYYYVNFIGVYPQRDGDAPYETYAVNDNYEMSANRTLSIEFSEGLLANDRYANSVYVISPQHGRFIFWQGNGSFTYVPDKGFIGQDSFKYHAIGQRGVTSTATVTIQVKPAPPEITGVTQGAMYNKDVKPAFTDGTALLNGQPFQNESTVSGEGFYTLTVTNAQGTATVSFTIDKTPPVITGVTNGETYGNVPSITFNEGTAKLNKEAFSSGSPVSAEGQYELVVTDQAGNVSKVSFTVNTTMNVSFDTDGGTSIVPQKIGYGGKLTKPVQPTREGYTFLNWYEDAERATVFDFDTKTIIRDTVLYAAWTINRYDVSFETNGAGTIPAQDVTYESKALKPDDPQKTGYSFGGWYANSELTQPFDFAATPIRADTKLYAKWTINRYAVTFESQGGTPIDAQNIDYGQHADEPTSKPTRTGYAFGGWYADSAGTQLFDFAGTPIEAATTLYAKWTINTYRVTFDSREGTKIADRNIEHGQKIAVPEPQPTRVGYAFGGWYEDETLQQPFDFSGTEITGDKTLYAKWTINTYTVAFTTGEGSSAVNSQYPKHGDKLQKPDDPLRTGYTFAKWHMNVALTQPFDFEQMRVTDNLILHAEWTINSYPVTFDSGGGTPVDTQNIDYRKTASEPKNKPTRTGYTFDRWYADADLTEPFDFAKTPIQNATTLYAKWTINRYAVTFDTGNGTSVPAQTVDYGGKAAEPAETPTRTGHTFEGWYADASFHGRFDFDAPIEQATTVYAKWSANTYTVTFMGDEAHPWSTQPVIYGEQALKPLDPTRPNYAFAGWYSDERLTSLFDFIQTAITEDLTLYAKWADNRAPQVELSSTAGNPTNRSFEVIAAFDEDVTGFDDRKVEVTGGVAGAARTVSENVYAFDVTPIEQGPVTVTLQKGTVVDAAGNESTASQPLSRIYDVTAPTLTLNGAARMAVALDSTFVDPGATAQDGQGGDLTGAIAVTGDVYTDAPNTYELTYRVSDPAENVSTVTRSVYVIAPPTVLLNGDAAITIEEGTAFADPGATASDTFHGDLSDLIVTEGGVDSGTPGVYKLKYTVTNSIGQSAQAERQVTVTKKAEPPIVEPPVTQPPVSNPPTETPVAQTPTVVSPTVPTPSVTASSTNGSLTLAAGQAGAVSLGNEVRLRIPAGATNQPMQIRMNALTAANNGLTADAKSLSTVYQLTKTMPGNFLRPVSLTLSFDSSKLADGEQAVVFYQNEDGSPWVRMEGGMIEQGLTVLGATDSASAVITVDTDHFTRFAVLAVREAESSPAIDFADLHGHWAEAAVNVAVAKGFVHGYGDGTFRPAAPVTRAEFAAMLAGALKLPAASGSPDFADAAKIGVWAKPAVASAAEAGLIHGYGDGTFRPNAVVTRAEMAVMLAAALGLPAFGGEAAFSDAASIPAWALGAAEALRASGRMQGKSGNRFDAGGQASRAETVQLLVNAVGTD
ncbi:InlB B-repeat-containing protein [Saccharibacillus sacchari]|uniref:InlB B-repeat-containing protein n=1 Tax=Saccharibacillus sacchari TaxID=456493 RepID=A0ACC6PGD0_9BACL